MRDKALTDAITRAGGPAALARFLGITTQAVSQWERCPIERVADVEKCTEIPREKLRPDVFGRAA